MKVILCVVALCVVAALGAEVFKPTEQQIRDRFAALDKNGDGLLQREEIINYLLDSKSHPDYEFKDRASAEKQVDQVFAQFDEDKSGALSADEVIKFVNSDNYKFFGIVPKA